MCGVTIMEVATANGVTADERERLFAAAERIFQIHQTDCAECTFGMAWLHVCRASSNGDSPHSLQEWRSVYVARTPMNEGNQESGDPYGNHGRPLID